MAVTASPIEDFAQRFGFESTPESVQRLSEMIRKRNANMEDFAKVVAGDADLSARLLRAANPRATRKEDYVATTVEDAIQRIGMSFALLLGMSDALTRAVFNTFQTMLTIELKALPAKDVLPFTAEHILGEVSFEGKTTGLVDLRFPATSVVLFGERMLGLTAADMADAVIANDVVGELCNMVVGNFKSNLCDAGLECRLSAPKIVRTKDFKLQTIAGGSSERYAFRAKELELFADLSVNPWVDGWKK
jgi:CheY-specific phosphatase CheX